MISYYREVFCNGNKKFRFFQYARQPVLNHNRSSCRFSLWRHTEALIQCAIDSEYLLNMIIFAKEKNVIHQETYGRYESRNR